MKVEKYNKLTFIKLSKPRLRINGGKRKRACFKCDCGDVTNYDYSSVKTGHTKSCRFCAYKRIGISKTTHGLIKHPLYRKWQDMLNRCRNPKVDRYKSYGGRGINVCEEWVNSFESFYEWSISNGWEKELTIDRVCVDSDYSPDNCRFISMREQGFNKRNTFYVEYRGVKMSLSKVLYQNDMSHKYRSVWGGVKKGKRFSYYVDKLNLDVSRINELEP